MNKRALPLLLVSIVMLTACVNDSSSKQTSESLASIAESSSTATSSNVVTSSDTASSSETDSSSDIVSSSDVTSSSVSSSSVESSSSTNPTSKNIVLTPSDAPAKEDNTYPVGKTINSNGVVFALENIMAGNQQPLDSNDKTMTGIDVIQAKALVGAIYNATAFNIKFVKITFLDKTSTYNTAYPVESVYGGNSAHPLQQKGEGGTVEQSFSPTGYKQITQIFTFPEGVDYVTVANDGDSSGDVYSGGRAAYFTSIEFNPAL